MNVLIKEETPNINKLILDSHLANEKLSGLPDDFSEIERLLVAEILAGFRVSRAMNNTEVWRDIAEMDSNGRISSELMLVIGISLLMRGEELGLLWLRTNFSRYSTAKNLHAYAIGLCQLGGQSKLLPLFIERLQSFSRSKFDSHFSFSNKDYFTAAYSILPYESGKFLITLENTFRNVCMRDIFLNGVWTLEPELSWLESKLSMGNTFVDIGVNAGIYSLLGAQLVGPSGKVFSFEPNPGCVENIKKSLSLNTLKNVVVVPQAVSSKEGELEYVMYAASDHNHLTSADEEHIVRRSMVIGKRKIPVTTLDLYFQSEEVDRCDGIKIDAEGYEKFVLEGALKTLKKYQPFLIVELNERLFRPNGYGCFDLLNIIDSLGYEVYRLINNKLEIYDKQDAREIDKSFNIIALHK